MRSLAPTGVRWMEQMLIHGIGDLHGQPFRLLTWHKEFCERWFLWDDDYHYRLQGRDLYGYWHHTEALVGAETGASKTEFCAALAMLGLAGPKPFQRLAPVITVAAASFEQAGELFKQCQIMAGGTEDEPVEAAPLRGNFLVYDKEIRWKSGKPGLIRRVAARAATSEGGKESDLFADEVHEWHGATARVFDVRAKSLSKRTPPGRVIALSTAGVGRGAVPPADTDPLLWRLYARGLMLKGDDGRSRYLFDWVEGMPGIEQMRNDARALRRALKMMRAADETWSVDARLEEILTRKIPWVEAVRYYFNVFLAMHVDSWLNDIPGDWEECQHANHEPPEGADVVLGVDMALHQDSAAVVAAGLIEEDGVQYVGWSEKHFPPVNRLIDHRDIYNYITSREVNDRWNVVGVAYDPRFFTLMARDLDDEGFLTIEFPQSHERLIPADTLVYDLVVSHRLRHSGSAVINAHSGNAVWRDTDRGRFFSKAKNSGRHMDLLRAGAMATFELFIGQDLDFVEVVTLEKE